MKVFISWSGTQSSQFATAFNDWLPNVFQSVAPFYSPEDIAAGERWLERLNIVLEEYDFGIVCLTTENLTAPWIMFESGALAKKLGKSKLVPVLCGVTETELSKNPLTQFQYVHTDKPGVRKLVDSIDASLGKDQLGEVKLTKAFEKWWSDLESELAKTLAEKAPAPKKKTDMDAAVEEMLGILRSLARKEEGPNSLKAFLAAVGVPSEVAENIPFDEVKKRLAKTLLPAATTYSQLADVKDELTGMEIRLEQLQKIGNKLIQKTGAGHRSKKKDPK